MNVKRMMKKIKKHMRRTMRNKLFAIGMFIIGLLSLRIDGDGTFLLFTIMISSVLFFSKEDVFER